MLKLTDKELEGIVDLLYSSQHELVVELLKGFTGYPFNYNKIDYSQPRNYDQGSIILGKYSYHRTTLNGPSPGIIQRKCYDFTESAWYERPIYKLNKNYGVTTRSAIKHCLEDLIYKYEVRNGVK